VPHSPVLVGNDFERLLTNEGTGRSARRLNLTLSALPLAANGSSRPNAAICDFHNDGPTPCEEANRRIFIYSDFNVSYILPFG
jgi:hypothetical protein